MTPRFREDPGVELLSLLANNVLIAQPSVYLAFRDHATSTRHEIRTALDRLRARGLLEFSVEDMAEEVRVTLPDVLHDTVRAALVREVAKDRAWVDPLPIERVRRGVYRIVSPR